MIEAISHLGEMSLEEKNLTEALTLRVPKKQRGKTQHVVEIDLLTDTNQLKIHPPYEVHDDTPLEFLWIGTADGPSSPQWYGTTSNVEYLLSQTIPNLLMMWDRQDAFFNKLQQTYEQFFIDIGPGEAKENRYRYIISPQYYDANVITEIKLKKVVQGAGKDFQKLIKSQHGLSTDEIQLFSLSINGERIIDQPFYRELIVQEKENVFQNAKEGVCSVIGERENVTSDTAKLKFNYYINDKINFASNFEKSGYSRNMVLGKKAYRQLMAGEAYIMRNFYTRFVALPCYVVPEIMFRSKDMDSTNYYLDKLSEKIQGYVETAKTVDVSREVKETTKDYLEEDEDDLNQVVLNFLFFTSSQNSLKVNKLIQSIPVRQMARLINMQRASRELSERFYGEGKWNFGLENIYYLIPMKNQGGNPQEKHKILTVYESMLSGQRISKNWLISEFVHLSKIYQHEQFDSYQIQPVNNIDHHLRNKMLQCQTFLWLMDKLTIEEGEEMEETIDYQLKDGLIVDYMKTMQYGEEESAMFLLGCLIAEVAAKQHSIEDPTKPILNKINYQGMNKTKISMLSTEVHGRLSQLTKTAINSYQESMFAEHKRLFDAALKNWSMRDNETVFYILAGYAFGTQKRFNNIQKEENTNEQ
ncbi:type I-B CRISPR-associated protein Cas8b/Csh1 [Salicibibacter kimchii]|uniref:Type I-B CRISPR-associated protein Cas8b/Csh1 n=1 Tax=Salicibibacter kimchii TaxID=2099786 RepID=A0A345C1I4_9BACI|nr:type I-B CRISPR-associated protein Cas8b/Csh1 [Salicibibacter kimchii]AXF57065.1 type I-B CRISPR-associated protein Cas8b/Csh1 [Salicibibacter kimchii]